MRLLFIRCFKMAALLFGLPGTLGTLYFGVLTLWARNHPMAGPVPHNSFDLIEIVAGIFGGLSRGIALVGDLAVLGLFAVSLTFTILAVSLWITAGGLESKRPWAQGFALLLGGFTAFLMVFLRGISRVIS